MQPIVNHLLLNQLAHAAIFFAVVLSGCSHSNSDVSVTQLAPKQQSPSEIEAPTKQASEIHPATTVTQPPSKPHVVRKEVAEENFTGIPEVFLSTAHSAMCRVRVGDDLPEFKLPQLNGKEVALSSLYGTQATVVLFWHPDRWMSHSALTDLEREVLANEEAGKVTVVGIAVETPQEKVEEEAKASRASFPQLLDTEGNAFDQVGMVMLPRVYVLDSTGQIVWFDIEYSESTRRELKQTLDVLTENK